MERTKLTAKKALELLSSIPEENFIVEQFTDEEGNCCAIGHLQRLTSSNPKDYSFNNCHDRHGSTIREISKKYLTEKYQLDGGSIATVNNGSNINGYNENTPKKRVIHLLEDMVRDGY